MIWITLSEVLRYGETGYECRDMLRPRISCGPQSIEPASQRQRTLGLVALAAGDDLVAPKVMPAGPWLDVVSRGLSVAQHRHAAIGTRRAQSGDQDRPPHSVRHR